VRNIKVALRKTSLVDYPGKVATALFFQGCNLRCPWCYNWELITGNPKGLATLDEAFALIKRRSHVLGGVVLSGGEPTLLPELPEIIAEVRKKALCVKLDTNGMLPDVLKQIVADEKSKPDFIAMDIKLPPERYAELTGTEKPDPEQAEEIAGRIRESIAFIKESGIEHEFRSLDLPLSYFSAKDREAVKDLADDTLKFRPFRGGNCLDEAWNIYL
jgi:pyruvate formate lyase activating enzyme